MSHERRLTRSHAVALHTLNPSTPAVDSPVAQANAILINQLTDEIRIICKQHERIFPEWSQHERQRLNDALDAPYTTIGDCYQAIDALEKDFFSWQFWNPIAPLRVLKQSLRHALSANTLCKHHCRLLTKQLIERQTLQEELAEVKAELHQVRDTQHQTNARVQELEANIARINQTIARQSAGKSATKPLSKPKKINCATDNNHRTGKPRLATTVSHNPHRFIQHRITFGGQAATKPNTPDVPAVQLS